MRNGSGIDHALRFAEVHNDIRDFPKLADVANGLGLSLKTVENYAAILRSRHESDKTWPVLISRRTLKPQSPPEAPPPVEIVKAPGGHTQDRATRLSGDMHHLFTSTLYPVINPEAMVTIPVKSHRYDRALGRNVEVEGNLKTWITDTLRVEGFKNASGLKFIFTGAQNDAPIHESFWENLLAYGEAIGAQVVVGPWTYAMNWWDENNPSARSYDDRIAKHLCFGRMTVGPNFMFCGEMNTLPTSPSPVGDLTIYAQGKWSVFPHSTVQLISVPAVDPSRQAFQIMSTGAVTRPQVIPRKAGVKAINAHSFGATLVEFDQAGDLFCRQITAVEDGSFQDLDICVADGSVTTGNRVKIVTSGDLHTAKLNPKNALATFGFDYVTGATLPGSLTETLRPEILVVHDIHDHESRNHHNAKDVGHNYMMAVRGREAVKVEIERSVSLLAQLVRCADSVRVIESNHDIALDRYIREARYRMDGVNYKYGLVLDLALTESVERTAHDLDAGRTPEHFSLLEWAMRDMAGALLDHASWVYDSSSYLVDDVQIGFHGFRGANGARGTITGFAKLGRKITIGDKHSPAIQNGVYCAGVMELQQGYNKGPSGWAVSHVVQYPNGTRSLVTLQNGKWRADC